MNENSKRTPVDCLGVNVARPSFAAFLKWFDECTSQRDTCNSLAIVNAHTLNLACNGSTFKDALNGFSLVLNDGAGLELYGQMASQPFLYNFNGTDLFPAVFKHRNISQNELKVFLLGSRPGTAAKAGENITRRFPLVKVVGVRDGYSKLTDEQLVTEINAASPHLLLVALGNPLQELWILKNRHSLKVGVACGIGALLDFLSESVTRAPAWMQASRMEWFYRLCIEPTRLAKRYLLGNPLFVMRSFYYLFIKNGKK
jgi:alpha-1,3-mannosyltransferase